MLHLVWKGREEQTELMEGVQEIKRSPQIHELISSEGIHQNIPKLFNEGKPTDANE